MFGLKINSFVTTAITAPFSLIKFAITHPLKAVTIALFASTLPAIQATQFAINRANDQRTCSLLQGRCNVLFDKMAEKTIPCVIGSWIDEIRFEGLPLNRRTLENRPAWAINAWKECMKHSDRIYSEDIDKYRFHSDFFNRAEILYAEAQVEEVLGNFTHAADMYSTASYWLSNAPDYWKMETQITAGQMNYHLVAQQYVARLEALTCEKPKEIEKAKENLLWDKSKGYFDYESSVDLLRLAFRSYINGDCQQATKLVELAEKMAARGIIDPCQYVNKANSHKGKATLLRNGDDPILLATDVTDDLATVGSLLKWLKTQINLSRYVTEFNDCSIKRLLNNP